MQQFGHTRTTVTPFHAFIAPDGHVPATLPGWRQTQAITLISPHVGARFSMSLVRMTASATSGNPLPGVERFVYVQSGSLEFQSSKQKGTITDGGYAFVPAETEHSLTANVDCELILIEKPYTPLLGTAQPNIILAHEAEKASAPFLGDDDAQLKHLLPDDPAFDMAVNIFEFAPGTPLPFVETHVMEHGLYMLRGGGVYRLGDSWYPIQAGDAIWMASYCPQWFGALGKPTSAYLYYKDVNRDPLILS